MTEQISALMDDELAIEDAAHIFTSMQSNQPAADAWRQYHLIGDVMRGGATLSPYFKQNLMQKLELEPTVLSPNAIQAKVSKVDQLKNKLPATWSIAASFAAVMVVGWMAMQVQTQPNNELAPVAVAEIEPVDQAIPVEYLIAHQASAPSASSYYIQSASYSESAQ
ncbi:MAG: sigma-E factor negative regulatory protein [Methylotenera sp.]|nr:sigma-E factor negative regulatory protein [Methylotenera sp.]MDP1755342.1 sigma-E factor negative regulatory protein [Methylotenera sp.]MDP1959227.1 sigma-E factor negative regulatory protein [Methylotenera sp.]MDP3303122.1 sigma-E factor negative regulatory protein [Methylotenera sp.]MDP3943867.1 sigma-E factor negative regulatory protein [Methylotenera sp.]